MIQHYLYCPHRWGLLEIEQMWAENYFVTKANIMHKRVHNPDKSHLTRGKRIYTAVSVFNDLPQYNLYGIVDCIEVPLKYESKTDLCLNNADNITIVEYKPTKPENNDYRSEDIMQVFAQKKCIDFIFDCNSEAVIYYGDVKKRYKLPVKEMYDELDFKLITVLAEMRKQLLTGKVPEIRKGQKCSGCSMKDLCMPKLKKNFDIRKEILE